MYKEQLRLRKEAERNLLVEKEGHERAKIGRDEAVSTLMEYQQLLMSDSSESDQPPSYFVCPISQEMMRDLQITADDFTYETVRECFGRGHSTSPMINLELQNLHLLPKLALHSIIQEWLSSSSSSRSSSSVADTGSAPIPYQSDESSERRNDSQSIADAENIRRLPVQEYVKLYEAKIDAIDSIRETKEYEAMYKEQLRLRKETERNLLVEKEGHERAKIERDEAVSTPMDCQQLLMYYKDEVAKTQEERDDDRSMEIILKTIADGSSGSDQPPSYFSCPILQEIMRDPQIAADDFTYEAETVGEWFDQERPQYFADDKP